MGWGLSLPCSGCPPGLASTCLPSSLLCCLFSPLPAPPPPPLLLTCRPGSGVSSFLPAQGQGVAVGGRRGHLFLPCLAHSSPAPHTLPQQASPRGLSLGCPLPLPSQQGPRIWGAHSATRLGPEAGGVLRRWQLGVSWHSAPLCSAWPTSWPCGPRRGSPPGAVPLGQLQPWSGLSFPVPSPVLMCGVSEATHVMVRRALLAGWAWGWVWVLQGRVWEAPAGGERVRVWRRVPACPLALWLCCFLPWLGPLTWG